MPERKLNISDIAKFNQCCSEFALPFSALEASGDHVIKPVQPILWFAQGFYFPPPYDVLMKDEKEQQALKLWNDMTVGVRYLANPYTKFNEASRDIREVAAHTFLAGAELSKIFPDSRIVLPKEVGFDPVATFEKKLLFGDFTLEYNLWQPGEVDINRTWVKNEEYIQNFEFGLTLKSEKRKRHFDIRYTF